MKRFILLVVLVISSSFVIQLQGQNPDVGCSNLKSDQNHKTQYETIVNGIEQFED
jgi:hypothetical protein